MVLVSICIIFAKDKLQKKNTITTNKLMKKNLTLIIMLLCSAISLLAATTNTLFDFGWKFYEGDVKGAQAVDFDDSKWQNEEHCERRLAERL